MTDSTPEIVVVASCNVDLIRQKKPKINSVNIRKDSTKFLCLYAFSYVDRFPCKGETLMGLKFQSGKSINKIKRFQILLN